MGVITRAQRVALKRVFDRTPLYVWQDRLTSEPRYTNHELLTYRQFRKRVHHASYDSCIMIQWCGMWLGIETDGYTHS